MASNQKLFVCGISGETPEEPVISPTSGAVFERRLIHKWIQENGSDPVNDAPLDIEQLIEIKPESLVRPKAPNHTSIPAMLKALQDEWDSVMLNSYSVRQNLTTTRQELSHALYQHDAACRVIARLQKETNVAREALATLKPSAAQIPQAMSHPVDESSVHGLADEIVQKVDDTSSALSQTRKATLSERKKQLAGVEKLHNYSKVKDFGNLHGAKQILSCDTSRQNKSRFVTGGADNMVVVYDRDADKVVSSLKGHNDKVAKVIYHPADDVVFSASDDATVRIWPLAGGAGNAIKTHKAKVTGISLHATRDYILSVSRDKSWAFSEVANGTTLTKAAESDRQTELCSAQFHPDGCLFGVGTADAAIKIWDIKSRIAVAQWDGHQGEVSAITFSENGYYVATASGGNEIKIWDLRKLKEIKSIKMREEDYVINSLRFDMSGQYLGAAGQDVRIYMAKTWAEVTSYSAHEDDITDVCFGESASFILTSSRDSTVKLYGDPDALQQQMES
jgi:pre-mRNA-processing factor 19